MSRRVCFQPMAVIPTQTNWFNLGWSSRRHRTSPNRNRPSRKVAARARRWGGIQGGWEDLRAMQMTPEEKSKMLWIWARIRRWLWRVKGRRWGLRDVTPLKWASHISRRAKQLEPHPLVRQATAAKVTRPGSKSINPTRTMAETTLDALVSLKTLRLYRRKLFECPILSGS